MLLQGKLLKWRVQAVVSYWMCHASHLGTIGAKKFSKMNHLDNSKGEKVSTVS